MLNQSGEPVCEVYFLLVNRWPRW